MICNQEIFCWLSEPKIFLPSPDHDGINDIKQNQDTDSTSSMVIALDLQRIDLSTLFCKKHATQQPLKARLDLLLCYFCARTISVIGNDL
jgi:hypothetical protein